MLPEKTSVAALALVALAFVPAPLRAQAPSPSAGTAQTSGAPRQSGTIKAVTPKDFVLTTAAGQDVAVNVSAGTRILLVDPATRDVKTAQQGTVADIAGGDKAIVTGTAGDTGTTITATRVYLLKSAALASMHAEQQAAWARSVGGIVRSVDPATGAISVANGSRSYTVNTTPSTTVRRYADGSVRFEDAVKSDVAAIHPGDQLQARGQRSGDGTTVSADEIVTGSFSNFSGLLASVDAAAGTVTLKDLATKKTVTVAVTGQSNLKHLPAGFGQGAGAPGAAGSAQPPAGDPSGSRPAAQSRDPQPGAAGQQAAGAGARRAGGRMDLARIVNRLPTETIGDLKPGEAVMIVASNNGNTGRPTAITMVSGVDSILAASPNGETTLSPWSLSSGESEAAEGGGAGGGGSH